MLLSRYAGLSHYHKIPTRCHSEDPLEVPCEMGLVAKPCLHRGLRDGHALREQSLGEVHSQENLIRMRREPGLPTEHTAEVEGTQADFARQPLKRYILVRVRPEVLSRPLHRPMLRSDPLSR